MRISVSQPALALGCAAALIALGSPAIAGTTAADHGRHAGQVRHSAPAPASTPASSSPAMTGATPASPAATSRPHTGRPAGQRGASGDHRAPAATAHQAAPHATTAPPAAHPTAQAPTAPARAGDPSGNNGTVKIDRLGDMDRIPNNVAHPGCTFQVEWYGFDGGEDVRSTVSFAMQAPTADVGLQVSGPTVVPVGGDAASGAGTDTGPDAVQDYTLAFDGAAQAQQGYHVRLTVSTPRSRGNDTKTKMFWVEPCASTAPLADALPGALPASPDASASVAGVILGTLGASSTQLEAPAGSTGMTGTWASQAAPSGEVSARRAQVPTAVEAGEHGALLGAPAGSALGLGLTLGGLLLTGLAAVSRLRRRA